MFFIVSKVIYFLIAPSHLCLLMLAGGVVLLVHGRWPGSARWLLMLSLTGFVVIGFSPIGNALMLPLEERFARPDRLSEGGINGIIMLGGFEDGEVSHARGDLALVDAAERLSVTVRLARQLPTAKVVFTGGAAALLLPGHSAHTAVGAYLRDVGVAPGRIVLEGMARNTWENAVFIKRLLQPKAGERYLLVTSAWHMPRAMGAFRQSGFDVTAYPVDYRTRGAADLTRPFSFLANGLRRVDKAVKEWIGLVVYWYAGRSSALFPAP